MEVSVRQQFIKIEISKGSSSFAPAGTHPVFYRTSFALDMTATKRIAPANWTQEMPNIPDAPYVPMIIQTYTCTLQAASSTALLSGLEPIFMESTPGALPTRSYDKTFVACVAILLDDKATPNPQAMSSYFVALNQRLGEMLHACWLNVIPSSVCELFTGLSVPPPLPAGVLPLKPGEVLRTWLESTVVSWMQADLQKQFKWSIPSAHLFAVGCHIVSMAELLMQPSIAFSPILHDFSGAMAGRTCKLVGEISTPWSAGWKGIGGGFQSAPSASASVRWEINPDGPGTYVAGGEADLVGRTTGSKLLGMMFGKVTGWMPSRSGPGPLREPPIALLNQGNRVGVFARGNDDCLRVWRFTGGANWDAEAVRLEGVLSSPVAGVRLLKENHYCLVARGAKGTAQVLMGDLTKKLAWTNLGGDGIGKLSIVSWEPGRFDLFGRSKKNTLQRWSYVNGKWSGPEDWGGAIVSDPAAVSWGKDRLDIFALDVKGAMVHYWYDATRVPGFWTHPISGWCGNLAAVSCEPKSLDVVGRNASGRIQLVTCPVFEKKPAWEYKDLGGPTRFDPAAVSMTPGRLDLFAVDNAGTLMQWTREAAYT